MSGGVDSSLAAALLLEAGYDVVGCFMRLGSEHEAEVADGYDNMACASSGKPRAAHKQGCCSVNDAADARLVAAQLGIPFYVLNFKRDFGRIIDYFVDEYNAGRTPNPCVRCNDWLKFGKLHDYARSIDAEFVASGHYARVEPAAASQRRAAWDPPGVRSGWRWDPPGVRSGWRWCGGWIGRRTSRMCCSARRAIGWRTCCCRSAGWRRGRCGRWRTSGGCRCLTSRTVRRFVSCRTGTMRSWSSVGRRAGSLPGGW